MSIREGEPVERSFIDRYRDLRLRCQHGDITFPTYCHDSLFLAADRIDANRNERNLSTGHTNALNTILISQDSKSIYMYGFHGGSNSTTTSGSMSRLGLLIHNQIGEPCIHHTFMNALVKPNAPPNERGYFLALQRDLEQAQVPNSLLAAAYVLKMQGYAFARVYETLDSFFDKSIRDSIPGNEETFWKKFVVGDNQTAGKEGLEFCLGFAAGNYPRILRIMEDFYEDDALEALFYWNAVLHMDPAEVRNNFPTIGDVRQNIFLDLAVKDLTSARERILVVATEAPYAFSEKYLRRLGLRSNDLVLQKVKRNIDRANADRLLSDEMRLELSKERAKERRELVQQQNEAEIEAAEKLKDYLGRYYILDETMFAGEDLFTVRRIIYLSDITVRPRNIGHFRNPDLINVPGVTTHNFHYDSDTQAFVYTGTAGRRKPSNVMELVEGKEITVNSGGYGTLKMTPLDGIVPRNKSITLAAVEETLNRR